MKTQTLIAITGLPGTGKTTFAMALAKHLELKHFNSDLIRNQMGMRGQYDSAAKNIIYQELMNQVETSLQAEESVIIDATFYKKVLREPIYKLGEKYKVPVIWIELQAADAVIKERMNHERPYSEADYHIYLGLKQDYEKLEDDHLSLRTDQQSINEMLDKTVAYLSTPPNNTPLITGSGICELQAKLGSSQLEESHISWIILTEKFAYKIPKPIRLPYLDFSTLEKQKKYCEEEIRLNNRLTSDIYLEVIPIQLFNNTVQLGTTEGKVVGYAIKMKRLPGQKLMSRMLKANMVSAKHVEAIANQLVPFHKLAAPVEEVPSIKVFHDDFADLLHFKHIIVEVLDEEAAGQLEEWNYDAATFLKKHEGRFLERHQQHYYIHYHGDLHASNIFLLKQPVIFDCIAFNKSFRQGDILNELAFFCMDMDYYKRADLGHLFLQNYLRQFPCLETEEDQKLFYFYKLYRANIRLKVNALKWQQNNNSQEQEKHAEAISRYFYLIKNYSRFLFHPKDYSHVVTLPQHQ